MPEVAPVCVLVSKCRALGTSRAILSDTPKGKDHTFRSVKTHNHSLEVDPSSLYDTA